MPLLVGLGRDVLQDFLLVGFTCLSLWLLLASDGLARRGPTLALGATVGLGLLTKVTFPIPILLPGAIWVARAVTERRQDHRAIYRLLANLGMAVAVSAALAAPWYVHNLAPTIAYIQSTTSGGLALGTGPAHPITIQAIGAFIVGLVNYDLSWPYLVLAGLAVAAAGVGRNRWLRMSSQARWALAFSLSWGLSSFLAVALQTNQDARLMAAGFPAFAVLVGGTIAKVSHRQLARLALAGFLLAGIWQTIMLEANVPESQLVSQPITFPTPFGEGYVFLGGQGLGYEARPGTRNDDMPLVTYLVGEAKAAPSRTLPLRVAILQQDPEVNVNTLGFLAGVAHANVVFTDLGEPGWKPNDQSVSQDLSQYNFLLYIDLPEGGAGRLNVLNSQSAGAAMTSALVAQLSEGGKRSFPLHGGTEKLWVLQP